MSEHKAQILWSLGSAEFDYQSYPRDHHWRFEGGIEVAASAAPDFLGNPDRVDPEEAFVASVASCHMLTFLAIAARKRFVVEQYEDQAVGVLEKNEEGKASITRVTLSPSIRFGGAKPPTEEELARMHHLAHENCFIANSVRTRIDVAS